MEQVRCLARPFRHAMHLGLALLLMVGACSSFGERVVAWYVTRQLDKYLDLTSPQERAARALVDDTLLVIRRDEVPHWISLLRMVRQGFHDGLDEPRLAQLQAHYDARLDAGVKLLAPRAAQLLVQLSPAQLDHFASRMREDVEEHYEDLRMSPDKRRKNVEKRAFKVIEDFVGDLEEEQERAIRAIIRTLPDERTLQHRSAHSNIARFRAFMAQRPSQEALSDELWNMWEQRYDALGPNRQKPMRRVEQRKALLAVYRLLNAEQRAHAQEELTSRIQTLKRFQVGSER